MVAFALAILLFCLGALFGSFANWAIYQLGYYRVRSISPLGPVDPRATPRQWQDRIPIVGWWLLRRDAHIHGRGFWLRPMLIEIGMACAFVWLHHWHVTGGLVGHRLTPNWLDAELWFAGHILLFWLLTIATFIDFDEKTIPDWITLPGTVVALGLAAAAPGFRLPEVTSSMQGLTYQSVTFYSPGDVVECEWHLTWRGLLAAWFIVAVWIYALLPKTLYWRRGLWFGLKMQLASVWRPRRRLASALRTRDRGMFGIVRWQLLLGVLLGLAIVIVDFFGGRSWDSLMGALLGLAYTGGLVWAVRATASWAMNYEAMGFGDVTLGAMIGAFVGWQAGLLVFAIAPFAALAIAIPQFALTRNRELAFGPYLALGALVIILAWHPIWQEWWRETLASLGLWIHAIIGACLVAMALMLAVWMRLRGD